MGCQGEIKISEDEDYDKWGIEIWVSFRDYEAMRILDGYRQSGGVRSLSSLMLVRVPLTDSCGLCGKFRKELSLRSCTSCRWRRWRQDRSDWLTRLIKEWINALNDKYIINLSRRRVNLMLDSASRFFLYRAHLFD